MNAFKLGMQTKLSNASLLAVGAAVGVAVSVQFSTLAQRDVEPALSVAALRELSEVYGLIQSGYVDPVDGNKLMSAALGGMVGSLDPHSAYLDKAAYRALLEGSQGRVVGIGIEVARTNRGNLAVVSVLEGSPAWRAGLRAGDIIVRINALIVNRQRAADAVRALHGAAGTLLTLVVERAGMQHAFTMARTHIVRHSVTARVVEPGYAWLHIARFQGATLADTVEALHALHRSEPGLKGLVLDLRGNPGGLLHGAIGVAAAFLPAGVPVASTLGRRDDSRQQFRALPEDYSFAGEELLAGLPAIYRHLPVVVLVNGGSASGSEIVAGALQEHKRALVMGKPTFGKGSVQSIRPLGNGTAVKLTTARFYTPNGRSIQTHGIAPDVLVDDTAAGDAAGIMRLREVDLERHLAGEGTGTAPELRATKPTGTAKAKQPAMPVFGTANDFQLAMALRQLKKQSVQKSTRGPGAVPVPP